MYKKQEIINRLQQMTANNVPLSLLNLADYFLLENEKMYRQQTSGIAQHAFLHFGEYINKNVPIEIDHCKFIVTGAESIMIEIKNVDGDWYFSKVV